MEKIYSGHSKHSGVYQILNKVNGKRYFGQAKQLGTRAMQHEAHLKAQKHRNKHLQASWNLYGPGAFQFMVLYVIEDKIQRSEVEQRLITEWYGEKCYNIQKQVNPVERTWSCSAEESRKKMSEAKKGTTLSEETKKKLSEVLKGIKRSEETRAKMSARMKGNTAWFGKTHSEESKAKMRASWLIRKSKEQSNE